MSVPCFLNDPLGSSAAATSGQSNEAMTTDSSTTVPSYPALIFPCLAPVFPSLAPTWTS